MKNVVVFAMCLTFLLIGCNTKQRSPQASALPPYETGKSEAQTSLSQGKLCWKLCGQPAAHDALFKQILKQEYKVDLLIVAGCNVPEELDQNVKGYNEVMAKAIVNHFGKDIVPLAEEKAKQQFQEQNKK